MVHAKVPATVSQMDVGMVPEMANLRVNQMDFDLGKDLVDLMGP